MKFTIKAIIEATPQQVFDTWMDSKGHSEMTGGEASISNEIGSSFTAWDGYISGRNLELVPNKKIVQSWRTTEFHENEEDSLLEIELTERDGKTELTMFHSQLPEHGAQYVQGWADHYFQPMNRYFLERKT
ncbi:MAG: SRPBCC domain-containing protein [Bacteroidia bacterium]|nr:SRPBCC domain-containing protein [Bacteroidia bacterium]